MTCTCGPSVYLEIYEYKGCYLAVLLMRYSRTGFLFIKVYVLFNIFFSHTETTCKLLLTLNLIKFILMRNNWSTIFYSCAHQGSVIIRDVNES